jgi:hypothetical protein
MLISHMKQQGVCMTCACGICPPQEKLAQLRNADGGAEEKEEAEDEEEDE